MVRKAAKTTPDQIELLLNNKLQKLKLPYSCSPRLEFEKLGRIGKDLSKVQFSYENFCEEYQHFQEGDLAFLLGWAGGDWEYPVSFIIYLDQNKKTLRGYIPKKGNAWNYDTKEAIGNDPEADVEFFKKWIKQNKIQLNPDHHEFDTDDGEMLIDSRIMLEEIKSHILVVGD